MRFCLSVRLGCILSLVYSGYSAQVDSDGKTWTVDIAAEYRFEDGKKPEPPIISDNPTVFIGISGFRDGVRCGKTLYNAFANAVRPDKVYIGVVEQIGPGDPLCLDVYCDYVAKMGGIKRAIKTGKAHDRCPLRRNVRVKKLDWSESKGPVYARALQQQLLQDEEFCLQVDSHSMFAPSWDVRLQNMYLRTENEYAMLTTYVHDIGALGQPWADNVIPHICKTQWGGWGVVRNSQAANIDYSEENRHDGRFKQYPGHKSMKRPVLSITWAAGMSFSKCHLEKTVPYDINLKQTFDGEEFSRFARAWTRGYDAYTPDENIIFHDYFKKMGDASRAVWNFDPPKIDPSVRQREESESADRLHKLLREQQYSEEASDELGIYGLGSIRNFEQLVTYTGIDPRPGARHHATQGERCSTLKWVPYDLSLLKKPSPVDVAQDDPSAEAGNEESKAWGPGEALAQHRRHKYSTRVKEQFFQKVSRAFMSSTA